MAARALCLLLCLTPAAASALDWNVLWLNDDQRAAARMDREDYAGAARTFDDPSWRAAAWYRAGEYRRAAEAWAGLDDVESQYNRANALARAGELGAAVSAYEAVLEREPGHQDARYNLEVIRELMQQSEESEGSSSDQPQSADEQDSGQSPSGRERSAGGRNDRGESASSSQPREDPTQQSGADQPRAGGRQGQDQAGDPGSGAEQDAGRGEPVSDRVAGSAEAEQAEQQAAVEQWLRRIPDDPGGLLRRKFLYQYRGRHRGDGETEQPW